MSRGARSAILEAVPVHDDSTSLSSVLHASADLQPRSRGPSENIWRAACVHRVVSFDRSRLLAHWSLRHDNCRGQYSPCLSYSDDNMQMHSMQQHQLPAQCASDLHSCPRIRPVLSGHARRQSRRQQKSLVLAVSQPAAKSAAVASAPTVDMVPKPMTSVLQDLTSFKGLPSLGITKDYSQAEQCFTRLLQAKDLDAELRSDSQMQEAASIVEAAIDTASGRAFSNAAGQQGESDNVKAAHLFLQRTLYKINRMVLFWFDDLRNYDNERSLWLAKIRDSIERPWQQWETAQLDIEHYKSKSVDELKEMVRQRAAHDVDPPLGDTASYIKNEMSKEGYRHLLAVVVDMWGWESLGLTFTGLQEYGTGRYNKKHSTFFATMMRELGLNEENEFYFDLVPWQSLASMNHNFLLTERRRHYLRYAGGLTFFEVNGPSVYRSYLAAARRVGLSDAAAGYWELHIKEDERHGRQMVEDVAVPLIEQYGTDGWEVLFGYDQEKMMGERAGAALVLDLMDVDKKQSTPAMSMT